MSKHMFARKFSTQEYHVLKELNKTLPFDELIKKCIKEGGALNVNTIATSKEIYEVWSETAPAVLKDSNNDFFIEGLRIVFVPSHCICIYDSTKFHIEGKSDFEIACYNASRAFDLLLYALTNCQETLEIVDYTGDKP